MCYDSAAVERLTQAIRQAGDVDTFVRNNSPEIIRTINEFVDGPPILHRQLAIDHIRYVRGVLIRENRPRMFARMLVSLQSAVARDQAAPRSADPDVRFGFRLADFLIGVDGAAIAQALRSYGETKLSWKIGLGEANDAANPMDDATFDAEARRRLPPHMVEALNRGLLRIEQHIGTGKYLCTRELFITPEYLQARSSDYQNVPDGAQFVLQLVKPGVAARADETLGFALDILNQLSTGDRVANVDVAGLLPIIQNYRETLPEETALSRARPKSILAVRDARKFRIELVENTDSLPWIQWTRNFPWIRRAKKATVRFDAAAMYEAGDSYRVSLRMSGVQFKDLPEATAEERRDKFFVALALFSRYLLTLLSGDEFNHDPTGANNRTTILPTSCSAARHFLVGEYDELGYCERPTDPQKEAFANMLMDAVGCALFYGIDLEETIKEAYCQLSKTMTVKDNVFAMLKLLLTICEYQAYIAKYAPSLLAKARVFFAVVQAVAATGEVDPLIARVMGSRFRGIRLLLKQIKPKSEIDRQLLADETSRLEQHYPIKESRGLGALMTFTQCLVFDWVAKNIRKGRQGPYRIVLGE